MRINPMTNTQLSTSHFRTSWITFIKAREYRGRVVALPCLKLRHGTNPNDVRMPSVMTAEESVNFSEFTNRPCTGSSSKPNTLFPAGIDYRFNCN